MVTVNTAKSGKFFENEFNLKELLTLSVAVTRINNGYVKKDADIPTDDNGVTTRLPNLYT